MGLSVPVLGGLVAGSLIGVSTSLSISLPFPSSRSRPYCAPWVCRKGAERRKRLACELRATLGIFLLAAAGTAILWLLTLQLAFHLSEIGFTSPVSAGIALGAPCLSGMASGLMYPALKRRLPPRLVAAFAFSLMALGYAAISLAASVPALGIGLLLCGFGFGFNQTNCAAWLLSAAPPEARGRAAAGLTFAVCFGQLVSPFVYQPLVSMFGSAATFALVARFVCLLPVPYVSHLAQSRSVDAGLRPCLGRSRGRLGRGAPRISLTKYHASSWPKPLSSSGPHRSSMKRCSRLAFVRRDTSMRFGALWPSRREARFTVSPQTS